MIRHKLCWIKLNFTSLGIFASDNDVAKSFRLCEINCVNERNWSSFKKLVGSRIIRWFHCRSHWMSHLFLILINLFWSLQQRMMMLLRNLIFSISMATICCTHVKIHDWFANGNSRNSKYFDNFTASVMKHQAGDGYSISGSGALNTDFVKGYVCVYVVVCS